MSDAKLLDASEERRKRTRNGRRTRDFLVEADSIIKLISKMVAEVLKLLLWAISAGMLVETAMQEWRIQHSKFKTPPALEQVDLKKAIAK